MSTQPTPPSASLNWLIDDLVRRIAGVRLAVVMSTDGLLLGRSAGIAVDEADHLSAVCSAMHSLASNASSGFDGGAVRQTVVELKQALLLLTSAGENACLAVLATPEADMGMVAYEMNLTVQQVGAVLAAAPRHAEPARRNA